MHSTNTRFYLHVHFSGYLSEHKYEIVKRLQARKHICGMTGDGVNDAPALKKADIGIAVDDATDAARSASDIVLTEPGLSVIISAVLTSRAIFQRMKNYTVLITFWSKLMVIVLNQQVCWTGLRILVSRYVNSLMSSKFLQIYAVSITIRIVVSYSTFLFFVSFLYILMDHKQ